MERKGAGSELVRLKDGEALIRLCRHGLPDCDLDVVTKGFFGDDPQTVPLLLGHDGDLLPVGMGTAVDVDDAVLATLRFYPNPRGQAAYRQVKDDYESGAPVQEYSYGFRTWPGAVRPGFKDGKRVRYLGPREDGSRGIILIEISMVGKGCSVGTHTMQAKGFTYPAIARAKLALVRAGYGRA
jgi:hypothetical protein